MRLYIAGPISSDLDGYREKFAEADALLRSQGFDTINPADNPPQPDWQAYMRLSLVQLARCDGIAMLPNWESSKGARLEHRNAQEMGYEVIYLKPKTASELAAEAMAERE